MNNFFVLKNEKLVYCDRPDKIHAKKAIDDFFDAFFPFLRNEIGWAIDIGASCGDSTVVMMACLAPHKDSRVLVFEPSHEIKPLLINNIRRNATLKVDVNLHPVAAGNVFEKIDFVYGIDNGGLMLPEFLAGRGTSHVSYQVQVVHTYAYLRSIYKREELDKIKFIKIDTEGYDYQVLKGLAPLIYKNQIPIICEWWNNKDISRLLFEVIGGLYYQAFNSNGIPVSHEDFDGPKKTGDLLLKPL